MPTKATAAIVHAPGEHFLLEDIELDNLRPDEVLIRIQASGVCHTDMAAQHMTPLPAVLGHEGAGVVESIGSAVNEVRPGDRVVISYPFCGRCPNCIEGKAYICRNTYSLCFSGVRPDRSKTISFKGTRIHGAFFQQSSFATRAITLARDVVVIPDNTPAAMLAAIPCGVQTGAGAVLNNFGVGPADGLVVFGAGAVGLSAVMAGHMVGAFPLIAVDIVEERLNLAHELGATHILNAGIGDVLARIKEIAPHGVTYALETSSKRQSFHDAVECLAMGGTCGIVTPPQGGAPIAFQPRELLAKGSHLCGIIQGAALPGTFLPMLLELNRQGKFPFERLIKTYAFAEINKAFDDSRTGRAIKPVLIMDG
jgi:aryl-alcohol dehydrogenase